MPRSTATPLPSDPVKQLLAEDARKEREAKPSRRAAEKRQAAAQAEKDAVSAMRSRVGRYLPNVVAYFSQAVFQARVRTWLDDVKPVVKLLRGKRGTAERWLAYDRQKTLTHF